MSQRSDPSDAQSWRDNVIDPAAQRSDSISRPPRIDVLIPVWNGAATLRSSLDSIRQQTVKDIRIIVVDDGSTDATPSILAEIAVADDRILVLTKPNGGVGEALNFGLEYCKSEFVARHDADDLAFPERFQLQLEYLTTHPDCVAVGAWARHMDADGSLLETYAKHGPPEDADPRRAPANEPYIMHPFLMARLVAIQQVGAYRYVFHAEDADLYWRLIEIGRLHILQEVLGLYRLHPASVMSQSILNGRILAVESQLAAISARRRRAGSPDLDFPRDALHGYHSDKAFAKIQEHAARQLTSDEKSWLQVAAAAKLLVMTSYRPYELDEHDCLVIRRALRRPHPDLTRENDLSLRMLITEATLRLGSKGRWREAVLLCPRRSYPRLLRNLLKSLLLPTLQTRHAKYSSTPSSKPAALK